MEQIVNILFSPVNGLKDLLAPFGIFARHVHDHFIPHHRNNYHPHILGHRALALMSGLLVTVKIFTLAVVSFGPVIPAFSSAITSENIINLTNQSRTEYQLNSLKQNSVLAKAAQAKADDMLAKGYFSHTSPDGRSPWDFIKTAGYSYLMAGENLAVNFSQSEDVETAWMNSPGHKANIVNKNFEEIGIGISQGEYQGHTAIFVVQMFGTAVEQKVALSPEPTPVQKAAVPPPAAASANVASASQTKTQKVASLSVPPQTEPVKATKTDPAPTPPTPQKINIQQGGINMVGEDAEIIAEITGPAVKVIAYFGTQSVMLSPKSEYVWTGKINTASLVGSNISVRLKAFGIDGKSSQLQLAEFSKNLPSSFSLSPTPTQHSFLGINFDPKIFENRFYLLFISGLLASLILSIAIKKHIQHLSLIANSSFVIAFATLLYWAG